MLNIDKQTNKRMKYLRQIKEIMNNILVRQMTDKHMHDELETLFTIFVYITSMFAVGGIVTSDFFVQKCKSFFGSIAAMAWNFTNTNQN